MPSRPFPARTIVTPLTSNNHCGHCRKHPETPGLSQYKRFIKKSADIHTYQRDAPPTPEPMTEPPARPAQVRDGTFPYEIPVGISRWTVVRYLRSYESDVIHGLLQTTDYALTVLRELRPKDTEEQIRRAVDLRMQRQRLLDQDPPLEAWIILDEGAIRRNIGGTAVMRHQLEHLIKVSRWPNVTLQVLAFECGAHAGLTGPFAILDFPERTDSDVAYTESPGGMIYLEKDREVRSCSEAFDRMRAAALSPAASAELIQRVLDQLG
jgi:hypothetical protein